MRTEAEICRRLTRIRREMKNKKKASLWRILFLQMFEEQIMWVLKARRP